MGDCVQGSTAGVGKSISVYNQPPMSTQPGHLSVVGTMSTSQRVVTLCCWGVNAGMVREWVAGKTVRFSSCHGPYLTTFAMGSFHNMVLYKCQITLALTPTNLASDILLRQKVLAFVIENNMNFLRAVATDVWSEHDVVRCISMHALLI